MRDGLIEHTGNDAYAVLLSGDGTTFTAPTGNGVVIAWNQAAGNTVYWEYDNQDISLWASSGAKAYWQNASSIPEFWISVLEKLNKTGNIKLQANQSLVSSSDCGFNTYRNFSRLFHKQYLLSPSAYRRIAEGAGRMR